MIDVADETDYIAGVDDCRPREILDHSTNANSYLLIQCLVDYGICIVNDRIGINDFTHVPHRGKSVVDYVCVPFEHLVNVVDFKIYLMSDLY